MARADSFSHLGNPVLGKKWRKMKTKTRVETAVLPAQSELLTQGANSFLGTPTNKTGL